MRRLLVSILALSAAGLASADNNNGRTLRVTNNGVDSASCGSKAHPCRSISQALVRAAPGDTILVGPGRYGDLNRNGVFGEPGEERPRQDLFTAPYGVREQLDCMICVDKAVTLLSTDGAQATVIDGTSPETAPIQYAMQIFATNVTVGARGQGFTFTNSGVGLITIAGNVRVVGNIATATALGFLMNPGGLPEQSSVGYSNGLDGPVGNQDVVAPVCNGNDDENGPPITTTPFATQPFRIQ